MTKIEQAENDAMAQSIAFARASDMVRDYANLHGDWAAMSLNEEARRVIQASCTTGLYLSGMLRTEADRLAAIADADLIDEELRSTTPRPGRERSVTIDGICVSWGPQQDECIRTSWPRHHEAAMRELALTAPLAPDWTMDDVALAELVLYDLGIGCDASREPGADPRRDRISKIIRGHVERLRNEPVPA